MSLRSERSLRLIPWLLAGISLAWVLSRIELAKLAAALEGADWPRYGIIAAAFTGVWWLLDAYVLSRLVTRFHRPISLREMLPLRGATYLLIGLSYDAAQAALVWLLHRRLAAPVAALGGTFLFYYLVDLLTLSGLATLGTSFLPGSLAAVLAPALGTVFAGLLLLAGIASGLARRAGAGLLERLRQSRLIATLARASLPDWVEFVLWRATFYASFIGFAALTLPCFGIRVPFWALVGFVPVIMSISALPITVAGIGSTQVAMWMLYGSYADEARVVAYALVYNATLVLLRLPIGLAFLARAMEARALPDGVALEKGGIG